VLDSKYIEIRRPSKPARIVTLTSHSTLRSHCSW